MDLQGQGSRGNENKAEERRTPPNNPDDCRCKETARMSPRELLKLMISDLAFWKKAGKR